MIAGTLSHGRAPNPVAESIVRLGSAQRPKVADKPRKCQQCTAGSSRWGKIRGDLLVAVTAAQTITDWEFQRLMTILPLVAEDVAQTIFLHDTPNVEFLCVCENQVGQRAFITDLHFWTLYNYPLRESYPLEKNFFVIEPRALKFGMCMKRWKKITFYCEHFSIFFIENEINRKYRFLGGVFKSLRVRQFSSCSNDTGILGFVNTLATIWWKLNFDFWFLKLILN